MRLKLDENLSRHLKPALNSFGHDVGFDIRIWEFGYGGKGRDEAEYTTGGD
jgi:hypothetical protein